MCKKLEMFKDNLLETNRGFNFYVDWSNVTGLSKYDIELHSLDALIGKKEDFDNIFQGLLTKIPTVVEVFPYLFALSKKEREAITLGKAELKVVGVNLDSKDLQKFSFKSQKQFTEIQIKEYLTFFEQMGLKHLFQNLIEKSTIDYVTGVLVGLDSNGRKNRGGRAFELACEPIIADICKKYGIECISQRKFETLREKGFEIDEDIAKRKADFILVKDKKCINIEVNYFDDTGSKPEEIIDSYINRQSDLKKNNISFALITDGQCWKKATNQLNKGLKYINYLMNYKMAKSKLLEKMIKEVFSK